MNRHVSEVFFKCSITMDASFRLEISFGGDFFSVCPYVLLRVVLNNIIPRKQNLIYKMLPKLLQKQCIQPEIFTWKVLFASKSRPKHFFIYRVLGFLSLSLTNVRYER